MNKKEILEKKVELLKALNKTKNDSEKIIKDFQEKNPEIVDKKIESKKVK